MKISIVVPVYNLEEYLPECLKSLESQTYGDLEIILVDDGSRDSSGALCDAYADGHDNTRVIHKANGGLVSAWKAGVEAATGEMVMFVDGDDRIDPEMTEEMAARAYGTGSEVICSDYIIERRIRTGGGTGYRSTSEYVYQALAPGDYDRQTIEDKIIPTLLGNENRPIHFSRCMKLISTSLVRDNIRYSDEQIKMAEDSMITIPVLLDAEHICVMDHKAYYHYKLVGDSMIHGYDPGCFDNLKRLINGLTAILNDKFANDPVRLKDMLKSLDSEIVVLMLYVLKNELRNPSGEYRERVRAVCTDDMISDTVKRAGVSFGGRSNCLLYALLKHPSALRITLLRALMNMNDARY